MGEPFGVRPIRLNCAVVGGARFVFSGVGNVDDLCGVVGCWIRLFGYWAVPRYVGGIEFGGGDAGGGETGILL